MTQKSEGKGTVVMKAEFSFEPGITTPEGDEQFEKFWQLFIEEAQAEKPVELAEREALRAHIAEQHGHAFNLMDLFWRNAMDAVNWGPEILHEHLEESPEDDAYAALFTTVTGLAARALLAFNEVTWLLRGGYPHGALTRVRSLHELFIVAAVLWEHGSPESEHPDLVDRYLLHHEVFINGAARDLIGTEIPGIVDTLNAEVLDVLDSRKKELIGTYGKVFSTTWGWAAPLFPKGTPSFMGLNKLIMPSLNSYYRIASEHLHASSAGLIDAGKPDETGVMGYNGGPTTDDLGFPAILGSTFLLALVGTIVPTEIHDPEADKNIVTGRHMLGILARLHREILDAWDEESAEDHSDVGMHDAESNEGDL